MRFDILCQDHFCIHKTEFLKNNYKNFVDDNGNNSLMCLVTSGTINDVKKILKFNKFIPNYINEKNNSGETALTIAVEFNKKNMIKYLLKKGCDITIKDIYGYNVFDHVCTDSEMDIVLLFSNYISQINLSENKKTFLNMFYNYCQNGLLKELSEIINDDTIHFINIPNSSGVTGLMYASKNNRLDIVKYLLSINADINIKSTNGFSALTFAISKKNKEVYSYLIAQPDVQIQTIDAFLLTNQ